MINFEKRRPGLLFLMGLFVWAPLAAADDALSGEQRSGEQIVADAIARGEAIARESQDRGEGFTDLQATARMVIRNDRGQEAVRELRISILDLEGDASRSLTVVDEPKDVRGTALLTHTAEDGSDEQWLYLPALKRVKRIASTRKSGPFMGSEFTYEDFSAQLPSNYRFKLEREEACGEETCWVLRRDPKEHVVSAYQYHLVWLDQSEYRVRRVEYYDKAGNHLKTLIIGGFEKVRDQWWRATELEMKNLQTEAVTTLHWSDIESDVGLTERDFDIDSLKAAR